MCTCTCHVCVCMCVCVYSLERVYLISFHLSLYYPSHQDSSAQYQPDPMRLRLAGLAGVTQGTQTPPLPPPLQQGLPPPTSLSLGDTLSSSSLSVPLLSAVISSLTAEKLAAILIQNNSTSGMSPQQQLLAPPMPHPPLPLIAPSTSLLGSMSPEYDHYSHPSRRGKQRYRVHAHTCVLFTSISHV